MSDNRLTQKNKISQLSLLLRKGYYDKQQDTSEDYSVPYGHDGKMTESIGAWPEFILKGTFCKRSQKGLCSPCFYSRFPLSKDNRAEYLDMVKKQVSYITDDFDALVVKRQYGYGSNSSSSASLVITPTGSYFDEFEFPLDIRVEMERKLVEFSESQNMDIHLHIESHCDDFLSYDISAEDNKRELDLLRKLNTKIIFGFESADEYARNVIYNKNLSLLNFEAAIDKVKAVGLIPGAFVFAGLFAYNDAQTHSDVISTVKYLINNYTFPVIMFQNNQPYTISDVLLKHGEIKLLEPRTLAWIVADVLALLQQHPSYWLIADPIGGPPEPDCHIFREPKYTCTLCSETIYKSLVELRTTRDIDSFLRSFEKSKQCECYQEYMTYIQSLPTDYGSSVKIVDRLLNVCQEKIQPYLIPIGGNK